VTSPKALIEWTKADLLLGTDHRGPGTLQVVSSITSLAKDSAV